MGVIKTISNIYEENGEQNIVREAWRRLRRQRKGKTTERKSPVFEKE